MSYPVAYQRALATLWGLLLLRQILYPTFLSVSPSVASALPAIQGLPFQAVARAVLLLVACSLIGLQSVAIASTDQRRHPIPVPLLSVLVLVLLLIVATLATG
jgi:hypothetical protein